MATCGRLPEGEPGHGRTGPLARRTRRRLDEAITILRRFFATPERGIAHDGARYRLDGVKAGPPPVHDIGNCIGGGGSRMLELVGRTGDGWVAPAGRYVTTDEQLHAFAEVARLVRDEVTRLRAA